MALHGSTMDALLSWVNSLKVDEPVERLSQLQDLSILIKVVSKLHVYLPGKYRNRSKSNGNAEETTRVLQQPLEDRLKFLCNFLQRYCRYGSSAENLVQWQKILHGENVEVEISKVIVLLLYYSNMKSRNLKELDDFDHKTQTELASILRFVLDNEEDLSQNDKLIHFLQRKGTAETRTPNARFPSSSDLASSSDESMSPNVPTKRRTEVRFLELHRVASSSAMKSLADAPSSPMIEVLHMPQFQMRRLKKQLTEEREFRDELELELSENKKRLAEKDAQLFLMQQRIERLVVLNEKQAEQQEPKELEELREKNESLMIRLRDTLKQCQDMKTDKTQLERKNDQLSEENGDLSYKVRDLSSRLVQLQEALNETSEEHELSLAAWQQRQSLLENELNVAINEKKYLEEQILILQGKISMLEEQLKKLGESHSLEKGESMGDILKLESLQQEVVTLTAKLVELQAQISQLQEEKRAATEEFEFQRSQFESEKLQLQEIVTNLQTSLSEITFQKERQDQEARAQEEKLMCQITTLKLEISKMKTTLMQKEEQLLGLHREVELERRQKGELMETLKKQEESSKQSMKALGDQVDHLGSVLKQSEGKVVELTQRLEAEAQQMARFQEECKKHVNERDSTLTMFNEYKSAKVEELESLNNTVHALEQNLQTNVATIEELKREKTELSVKVQELDATILDLIAKCQNLDAENDTQSKAHASALEALKSQLIEQESQLRVYEQKVALMGSVTEENTLLKEQLASLEDTVRVLKGHLENERAKYATSVEREGKTTSKLEEDLKKLSESRDQALVELQEEKANGRRLESRLRDLEEEYRVGVESFQAKLTETTAGIEQQHAKQEELALEVNKWKGIYEETKQGIAQSSCMMEEQIETVKKDYTEVSQQLEKERTRASELEAQLANATSAHSEAVSKLKTELSAALNCVKEKEVEEQKLLRAIQSAEEKLKLSQQEATERISHMESSLSNSAQDLQRISRELSEEKNRKLELEAKVKQLEDQKSEKTAALESEMTSVQAAVRERESEARKLSEEVSLLKKQLEESRLKHQEELNERNKVIKQREEERERAAGDLAAEKAAKAEVEAQLQKSLDTHKSEFTSLQNELSRSLDLIAVKESELERLAKEVSLREDQLQQQQQKVSVLANEVTALKALEVKSSTQEEEIKRYTQNVKSMEVEITALKTSICEKEREVERSQNDLAVKERENSSIREQYQTALGEVQALRPSVADLMKKCSEQDELIVLAHKEAADAKALASEKASVSERQREGIEGLEAKIQQEQQKTRELLKQLEDSRSCETERESSLEALKKELFHKVQELEQSQKALNDSSRELSSALSETQQKGKSLTEAEEQIAVCRAEIERKTGEMSVLQAEVKSLTERLASNEKSCVEFKDQLASERNKSAMLEDGLKKLQAQLDASSKELAEKQGALQRVQSEALSFKETAEKQSVSVEELQKKLTSQNEVKEGLESEIRAWKEKFDQREEQMSRLQNQLSGSQNVLEELASLKNSYQELKAQRLVMEEKHGEELEEHQKRAECLRAELEKAKGEISELMELKDTLGRRELLLQTLQAEKAGYLTQIAELQQANGALSHLSDQGAKKLEAELSKITNQHTQEVQALRRQYEKAISEGKEEAQELGQKLQAVTSKYDHAKTRVLDERQKFQEEKQKLLLQVEQLETAKKDQSEQVQELSQKLNQQEKTIRTQQQKLKLRESEVREEVDGKQKRVAELETQLEQQMQAVEHYKSQMEKARVHYDAKKAQNQELSDELQKVLREQEPLRKEHAELKTECERLGKELQHSLLQNKETEQSCKNLTAQVRTLEAQVEYADRQLRELGKFQVATDAMKSRETLCPSRVIRQSHADVSIDSLDMSDEEEHPMNSTGKNGRSHQGPAASSGSLESLASGRLPRKVESLESLYFTPIPTRAQSKLDSSIGSIGDLSLDSSKKTRSARRRTTQIINITMTKKTKEEPESANTSFYSLRSALSHQSLHPEKLQRSGRPQPAVSAPALSSLPSQESLLRPEHTSSDDSLNNSVLMNLPGYRPTTRSSTRLSQAGGRNSFYMGTCQDEPDPQEDWNRIAELQLRNRACPPHLKTSYPLESRPSLLSATITDDEVKMGDPKETLRRATLLPSQIQESTTRRMTLASSGIDHSWGSNVLTRQQQRKRVSEESHQGPDTPESKKSASCFPRPMTPKDKHDARKLSTAESKSNVNPQLTQSSRRQTMSFNILNTPKKLGSSLLRRGLGKKTPTPKNSPRAQGGRGNTGSTSTKSPLHTIRKSPSRKSPRVSKTKSPRTSSKAGQDDHSQFFERKQTRNK